MGEDPGDEAFLPGEALNFEANFYLPRTAGIALAIGTFIIEPDHAGFIHSQPPGLTVIPTSAAASAPPRTTPGPVPADQEVE